MEERLDKLEQLLSNQQKEITEIKIRQTELITKQTILIEKLDNFNSGVNRGLWLVGGGFIVAFVSWVTGGGLGE